MKRNHQETPAVVVCHVSYTTRNSVRWQTTTSAWKDTIKAWTDQSLSSVLRITDNKSQ